MAPVVAADDMRHAPYGDSWRPTPEAQRARDLWKLASRGFILRVFYRLEERGFSVAQCAEIWDASIGARWFAGLIAKAVAEGPRALQALANIAKSHSHSLPDRCVLTDLARAGLKHFNPETVHV